MQEGLNKAKEVLELQGQEGMYNANTYMLGMYNGMELIISILEERTPEYRSLQDKAKEDN